MQLTVLLLRRGDEVGITACNEVINGKVCAVKGDTVTVNITVHASKVAKQVEKTNGDVVDQPSVSTVGLPRTVAVPLYIQVLTPGGDLVSNFAVNTLATIKELKEELVSICGADEQEQTLLHGQDVLDNVSRWMDTSVKDADVVTLAIESREALTNTTIKEALRGFCQGGNQRKKVEHVFGHISRWNTAEVTDMSNLLEEISDDDNFNEDLSAWDVSEVTDMSGMFNLAVSFNGDLSAWSVDKVTNMGFMFSEAESFNSDLSAWNVSSVRNMEWMFQSAESFNGDVSEWNVSSVTDMNYMFKGARMFNGDLSAWNVSKVTNMMCMFEDASMFNGNLSAWNVSRVTDVAHMFYKAHKFSGDLSAWDVTNVRLMDSCSTAVKHAAALPGVVTHAANNCLVMEQHEDGLQISKLLQETVQPLARSRPRRRRTFKNFRPPTDPVEANLEGPHVLPSNANWRQRQLVDGHTTAAGKRKAVRFALQRENIKVLAEAHTQRLLDERAGKVTSPTVKFNAAAHLQNLAERVHARERANCFAPGARDKSRRITHVEPSAAMNQQATRRNAMFRNLLSRSICGEFVDSLVR